MKILAVAFSHHVLVDGEPRRLEPQFSGPRETELLQVKSSQLYLELLLVNKISLT